MVDSFMKSLIETVEGNEPEVEGTGVEQTQKSKVKESSTNTKSSKVVKEDDNDVSAAVEQAKSNVVDSSMSYPLAAESAANKFKVNFEDVYRGLQRDMELERDYTTSPGDEEDVSAAVERAKDLMNREGMNKDFAAQAASLDFDVPYDEVKQGLEIDSEVPVTERKRNTKSQVNEAEKVINEINFDQFTTKTLRKIYERCRSELNNRKGKK